MTPARRAVLGSVTLLLSFIAMATTTAAQSQTAPHLSPENKTLYAHHNATDTAELTAWMNPLEVDPTADDIALGPTGNLAGSRAFTITMDPGTLGRVELDTTGKITVNAFIGAGSGYGVVRVSTEITYGGVSLATGDAQNHVYQASGTGAVPYAKVTWSLTPKFATLEPGKPLVWKISIDGAAYNGCFLGVHKDRGKSHIVLPVKSVDLPTPAAPGRIIEDLTGPEAMVSLDGADGPNRSLQYNWTTALESAAITYNATMEAGSVSFAVADASGSVLAAANATASTKERVLVGVTIPGNWTITIDLLDYQGTFVLHIGPPPPEPSDGPANDTQGPGANDTGTPQGSESGGLPAPSLLVAGIVVAAVAFGLRRRFP